MTEEGSGGLDEHPDNHLSDQERAQELLHEGQLAIAAGKHTRAHTVLKQAAHLNPKDENVWWVLLEVLKDPDDKQVCLENILKINPEQESARRQLDRLKYERFQQKPEVTQPARGRQLLNAVIQLAVTLVVIAGLMMLGILIGVMLNQL